jgi:hypothetical protein
MYTETRDAPIQTNAPGQEHNSKAKEAPTIM